MVKFMNQGTKYYDVKVCPQTDIYTMCNGEYWFCFGRYNELMSSKFKIDKDSIKEKKSCNSVSATMNANISCTQSIVTSMETYMTSITSTAVPSAETSSSICSTKTSVTSLASILSIGTSLASITLTETSEISLSSIISTETSLASIIPTKTYMTSIGVIYIPSPSPINCSTDGIWPETLPGHNATGFYCYKGTVNGK